MEVHKCQLSHLSPEKPSTTIRKIGPPFLSICGLHNWMTTKWKDNRNPCMELAVLIYVNFCFCYIFILLLFWIQCYMWKCTIFNDVNNSSRPVLNFNKNIHRKTFEYYFNSYNPNLNQIFLRAFCFNQTVKLLLCLDRFYIPYRTSLAL